MIEIEPFDQPNSRRVRGGAVEPIDLTLDSDSEDEPVVVSENNGNRRSRNSGGSRFEAGRRVEVALPGRGHATVGRQRQNQVARRLTDQDVGDALEGWSIWFLRVSADHLSSEYIPSHANDLVFLSLMSTSHYPPSHSRHRQSHGFAKGRD